MHHFVCLKRSTLVLVMLLAAQCASAQSLMKFRISKTYCLLNFLQTTAGANGTSSTLREYIRVNIPAKDTAFSAITRQFRNLRLDYSFTREEYPVNRHRTRSTFDLISAAAVNAADIQDFSARIAGILPNTSHQQLIALLRAAEPYYNKIIWDKEKEKAYTRLKALEAYADQASLLFEKLSRFYSSSWKRDYPFTVAIYPIPGHSGNTTATPHGNNLCVGVLTDGTDHKGTMGVVLHEMCHVLYDEQPEKTQHQQEHYFASSKSLYSQPANNFFDEGLATALGNGWAYTMLNGTPDTAAWYSNTYIDGFAHALYPMVTEYINKGKSIDSMFVARAISLFGQQFPNAVYDYGILLNRVTIYMDGETEGERNTLMSTISKHFQVSNSNMSSPILHEYSKQTLSEGPGTQFIIIDRDYDNTLKELKALFPQIGTLLPATAGKSYYLTFLDLLKRPVIIVKANNPADFNKALERMSKERYIDAARPYHEL